MNAPLVYSVAGILFFVIGLRGLIVYAHLLRKALAMNVMSTGIFMFLVALAGRAQVGKVFSERHHSATVVAPSPTTRPP